MVSNQGGRHDQSSHPFSPPQPSPPPFPRQPPPRRCRCSRSSSRSTAGAAGHRLRSGRSRAEDAAALPSQIQAPGRQLRDQRGAGHGRDRYAQHLPLSRARQRPGAPLRHRRRPRGLHLGRHQDRREEGRMAGLASAAGDDRAPALSAALHGRRPRQPARRPRHVSLRLGLSHPRHQRAADHRPARVLGLHPPDQRGRQRPLRARHASAPRSWCCR